VRRWLLLLWSLTAALVPAQAPSAATNGEASPEAPAVTSAEVPDPSGAYYDWTKTRQPERPYIHRYDQTLVMKIFLAEKQPNGGCLVHLNFEEALEVIRKLDNLTCGIPKIVYLVGWQHNGHDSMEPDWSVVNPRLKRDQDATALDSLKWLMAEAFKYHTTVSLHINMIDATQDSPLWDTYVANNVVAKDKCGNLIKGEHWGSWIGRDTQSYQLSYDQEWKTGLARKRIDALLAMLPIEQAGTIHIDAFHSVAPTHSDGPISPFLGNTIDDDIAAQRKIFRYFRDRGVDVTCEGSTFLRKDPFVGLQPMAWHYDPPGPNIPARLYCGTPMAAEEQIKEDPQNLHGLKEGFCLDVLPWYDQNNSPSAPWGPPPRASGDVFLPALWLKQTLIAFSKNGCHDKTWQLPPGWEGITQVQATEITLNGPGAPERISTEDGNITLSLSPGEGLEIQPVPPRSAEDAP
jgi:hypothetical protein